MTYAIIALFVALAIVDIITTYKALHRPGFYEANPIPRALFKRFGIVPVMTVIKVSGIALFTLLIFSTSPLLWKMIFKWTVIAALMAGSAYVAYSNLKVLRA